MHGSLYDAFDATLIALDVELQYEHDSMLTIPQTLAPRIAGRVVETEEVPGRFLFAHDGVGVRVHELPRIFHIDGGKVAAFQHHASGTWLPHTYQAEGTPRPVHALVLGVAPQSPRPTLRHLRQRLFRFEYDTFRWAH